MNTRWSELAEECWDMRVNEWHFDQEMFAELIIKECAEIALREEHDPYECILKHFGLTDDNV